MVSGSPGEWRYRADDRGAFHAGIAASATPQAVRTALHAGARIQLCLVTAYTCPCNGPTDPRRVIDIANDVEFRRFRW